MVYRMKCFEFGVLISVAVSLCCIIEGTTTSTTTETKCDGNDTYDGTECHLIQELMAIGKMDKEIENKSEKVNGVYNLTVQLLPALEKTSKSCLTESILNRKKCNVGEVNCTEINLIDNSVNCSVCVDGTLTPVTDDGSLDYCAHFVSLKKARLSITVEDRDKGLKFSTLNGNVTGNIIVKPTHQDEDSNSKVKCSWALYSYSNINGDSQLLNLINKLLHCDTKDKWLCLETESYNNQRTGVCYSSVASCIIQGKNSIPTCSLVKNVEVKVNTPCSSGGHVHRLVDGIDKCNFTWKFNKEDLIYDETKIYFNFNWNNDSEIKIKDFKCFKGNSLVCSNNVSTCSTEYHYDYSNCMFSTNPPPPTKAVSNPTTTDMTDTTTLLLIIIIVILGVFFVVYVGHKNYQKIKNCSNGYKKGRRLLPTSIEDDWVQSEDDNMEQFQWKNVAEVMKNEYV